MSALPEMCNCEICLRGFPDKTALVEHLRAGHEPLEVESYVATSMMMEDERNRVAREFFRQIEVVRKRLRGEEYGPCSKCGKRVRTVKNDAGKWVLVNEDQSPHEHSV